jgi:hypothetical protein
VRKTRVAVFSMMFLSSSVFKSDFARRGQSKNDFPVKNGSAKTLSRRGNRSTEKSIKVKEESHQTPSVKEQLPEVEGSKGKLKFGRK